MQPSAGLSGVCDSAAVSRYRISSRPLQCDGLSAPRLASGPLVRPGAPSFSRESTEAPAAEPARMDEAIAWCSTLQDPGGQIIGYARAVRATQRHAMGPAGLEKGWGGHADLRVQQGSNLQKERARRDLPPVCRIPRACRDSDPIRLKECILRLLQNAAVEIYTAQRPPSRKSRRLRLQRALKMRSSARCRYGLRFCSYGDARVPRLHRDPRPARTATKPWY